jgi:hypothetical protein
MVWGRAGCLVVSHAAGRDSTLAPAPSPLNRQRSGARLVKKKKSIVVVLFVELDRLKLNAVVYLFLASIVFRNRNILIFQPPKKRCI